MSDNSTPGPDPSSLRVPDDVPDGIQPISMRITYSSDSVSDWVSVSHSRTSVKLELAEPLLSVVRKVVNGYEKVSSLRNKLATVSGLGLLKAFKEAVAEFVNNFLPVPAIQETAALGFLVMVLKWLHNHGMLLLGFIHQASPEELSNWLALKEQAKWTPGATVE